MPVQHQLTTPVWLSLSAQTRSKLASMFNLKKTGRASFSQVNMVGTVTSDGHTHTDLSAITLESMRKFVTIPEGMDFWKAFDVLLASVEPKIESVFTEPMTAKVVPDAKPLEAKPRMGRPPKVKEAAV